MNTIIVDNFFDNFENIEQSFKNIKRYSCEEYTPLFGDNGKWPGFRSQDIFYTDRFLFNLVLKEMNQKINHNLKKIWMSCHTHLRLNENKEPIENIHKDPCYATLMVFLSKTNLKSGTCLFDENQNLTTTVNFVQNRAVIFKSDTFHSSLYNHGESIEDGRLTLNAFIYV